MGLAQDQTDYELSLGTMTDISGDGLHPYQRALAAGYPVAGDLSQGGFYTELLFYGTSVQEAVHWWENEPFHRDMLLATAFVDAGAGIASSGGASYYILVAGRSTGETAPAYTPPSSPSYSRNTPTMVPSTPNADGSIVHVVRQGDTLGSISLAYDVSLADILKLNGLTIKSIIYVGQKIVLRLPYTPTPTQPTSTPTARPTITLWPTSTITDTVTPLPPTPTPAPALPASAAGKAVEIIVIGALLIAGLLALLGRKRK